MTTDTLAFPPIVEPPAVPVQPAPLPAVQQPDLTKIELTAVALAQYGDWRKDVAAVKANLSTLALDLTTPTKIKEARTLRQRLIGDPLASVRKVAAGIKSKMAQTSKAVGAELEAIEAAYAEADALILPQIEKREAELEREREEARQREEVRKEKHRTNLEAIRIYVERAAAPGMTSDRIARGIAQLEAIPTPTKDAWEEFAVPAANAICETLEKMRALHAKALSDEAATAEAERVRKENEELRARLAAAEAAAAAAKPAEPPPASEAITLATIERGATLIGATASRVERAAGSPELAAAMDHIAGLTDLAPVIRAPGGPITMIEPAPAPADEKPTLNLGAINDWLAGPVATTAAGLALLGIHPSSQEKAAKLYKPSDKARIKAALIEWLEGLQ